MVLIQFFGFFYLTYFIGRGLKVLTCINHKNYVDKYFFGIKENFFYPIYSLFFVGNLIVISNFFVKSSNIFIKIIILLLLLINFMKIEKIKFSIYGIIAYILTPAILSISTIGSGLHKDMLLYHLNYQNWINSEKIVIGLTNINGRYGFSSLHDYISSILWLKGDFILLHYMSITFYFVFFNFLLISLLSKRNDFYLSSLFILIFGILDNFGVEGGRNGFLYLEGVGKQDSAFSILFYISNILLFTSIFNKNINKNDFLMGSLLVAFSIQLRITGLITLIPLIYYFYLLNKKEIKSTIEKIKLITPITLIGVMWTIKNILISGCIIYPVEVTCLTNLNWYIPETALNEAGHIGKFYNTFSFNESLFDWYKEWSQFSSNYSISLNFIASLVLIYLFKVLVYKKEKTSTSVFRRFLPIYILINFTLWIMNAPAIRLGMGFILLTIGILGIDKHSYRSNF